MSRLRIVDTTLRDGSHAIAAPVPRRAGEDRRAGARPRRRLGDRRRARRRAGRELDPVRPAAAHRRRAAGRRGERDRAGARSPSRSCPGIGTRRDLEAGARGRGVASRGCRPSAPRPTSACSTCGLARELGMTAHTHLNTAHLLDPDGLAEAGEDRRRRRQPGRVHRRLGRRVPDRRRAPPRRRRCARRCPTDVAVGIHEHNNLSLAVANSAAAIAEGATLVDTSLAGLGAGAGNCQTEVLVAVLERMGIATGIDLWALQDVADEVVRAEVMQRPIEIDRLDRDDGLRGRARELPAARDPRRRAVRHRPARDHRRARQAASVVVGQEDAIIGIAAAMATPDGRR